jgi:transposase InsO family protein
MKVSTRTMTQKQLQVYGARIRLAWFRKADELGSVVEACKWFGIARSEYYYWHQRWLTEGKQVTALYDKPRVPKSNPNIINEELAGLIVGLRLEFGYGKHGLAKLLQRDYGIAVSHQGVNNVLRRAELLTKRTVKPRPRKLSDQQYVPGERGQMDVKHWKRTAYQYDIIDCATRLKYKRLYYDYHPRNTIDFLEHATRFFEPAFSFKTIQTDNGSEFTYTQFPQMKKIHPATEWLTSHNIEHRLIKASSPQLNGFIERSHGSDKYLRKHFKIDYNFVDLKRFLVEDCERYNTYRPHTSLGMKTPLEYLQSLPGFENATINLDVLYV